MEQQQQPPIPIQVNSQVLLRVLKTAERAIKENRQNVLELVSMSEMYQLSSMIENEVLPPARARQVDKEIDEIFEKYKFKRTPKQLEANE